MDKKSQKGADGIVMKRKIYQQLIDWKEKRNGEVALLVEGARRIGKSYIVEEFGKNEYEDLPSNFWWLMADMTILRPARW